LSCKKYCNIDTQTGNVLKYKNIYRNTKQSDESLGPRKNGQNVLNWKIFEGAI